MSREAEVGMMHFKDRGRGHKPRNAGSLQKLAKTRDGFSLESPEEMQPVDTLVLVL